MYFETLTVRVIYNYFRVYATGAIFLGLSTLSLVYVGATHVNPNIENSTKQILKLLLIALGCYTIPFNMVCGNLVISTANASKHQILSALGVIIPFFCMLIGLVSLLTFSGINMMGFMACCFFGMGCGVVFLVIDSKLRKEAALVKKQDEQIEMEEGGKKISGFTYHIE